MIPSAICQATNRILRSPNSSNLLYTPLNTFRIFYFIAFNIRSRATTNAAVRKSVLYVTDASHTDDADLAITRVSLAIT